MRPIDVERFALEAIDRLKAGHSYEDDVFEFKSQLPKDKHKLARLIGGHANAAKRADIIWIVGFDGKSKQYSSPCSIDFADWWDQIKSCFDGPAPEPSMRGMRLDTGEEVTLFSFETSLAPYVVKRPDASLEVPYRTATGTHSASRHQLLRLLSTAASMPGIEVLGGFASIGPRDGEADRLDVSLDVYLEPNDSLMIFPKHKRQGTVSGIRGASGPLPLKHIAILRSGEPDEWREDKTVTTTPDKTTVSGPALVVISGSCSYSLPEEPRDLFVEVELKGVKSEHDIRIAARLLADFSPSKAEWTGDWILLCPSPSHRD